jgi:hypothetical protein
MPVQPPTCSCRLPLLGFPHHQFFPQLAALQTPIEQMLYVKAANIGCQMPHTHLLHRFQAGCNTCRIDALADCMAPCFFQLQLGV